MKPILMYCVIVLLLISCGFVHIIFVKIKPNFMLLFSLELKDKQVHDPKFVRPYYPSPVIMEYVRNNLLGTHAQVLY